MYKKIITLISLLTFSFATEQAMIVLDASGSMMGKVDNKAKITIAKDTLNKVVNDWDESISFGLMAYGHRKKGDCSDIEVLIPISKIDKESVLQKVKDINPKGKTPISDSLKQAADKLRYTEDKATVILISDGKETCDEDPCQTAKELKSKGVDFVAHVIGFNVDTNTDKQLECIAKATGGEYFSAKNTSELNSAMKKAVKKVVKKMPMKKVVAKAQVKYDHNLLIGATEVKGGTRIDAFHRIYKVKNNEDLEQIDTCSSFDTRDCKKNLPAGDYAIKTRVQNAYIPKTTDFTIKEGERTIVDVITGEMGELELVASKAGQSIRPIFQIRYTFEGQSKIAKSCYPKRDKQCIVKLPPRNYEIRATYEHKLNGRNVRDKQKFEAVVKPNEHTVLETEFK